MPETRFQVLQLYRALLRACEGFADTNVRAYAKRRVQAGFRENRNLQDPQRIDQLLEKAQKDLEMVRRQTTISKLYPPPPYVVEATTRAVRERGAADVSRELP
ncbi:hypothetical protein, conserved [Cyanidioschyzon merolae strain 10D]|jgi:hypothetical protein|uniref:Complex 1 LYR protein domain-containing protein n=1 Tax=Cyanidioschyzon merolae (strain NIES-3377 / 10D) TaxID=280699 RepID=M1UTU6_CYAM1|nr:hypothetical protein, conserved [Cyanidioschyzon merolae strain 10D]BAM81246.1 hypothetical protein, conserved [Cyanidioschyzon merolae strain 10D]|eukprot:XP_005537282.1 hypothetical protein, conserved [Cyanidioschyzon merolae strain 10D]